MRAPWGADLRRDWRRRIGLPDLSIEQPAGLGKHAGMGDEASIVPVHAATTVDVVDVAVGAQGYDRYGAPITGEGKVVIDDWPDAVPVSGRELDVIETWFAGVLDVILSSGNR